MKILAVLYCYPPLLFPATMHYLKLVKGLHELGAAVEVVTVDPETFVAPGEDLLDPQLEELAPAGVINHRIRSWETHPVIRALKSKRLVQALLYPFFEPRKREWIYPALLHLRRQKLERFDLILSCSQPHCNHLLGLHLKRLTGKPWAAIFSDPWTDSAYASYDRKHIYRYHLRLETKVLETADRIFFNSPETADLVLRKYPAAIKDKCGVLPHGFVREWYGRGAVKTISAGPVRVVQTGHFYGPRTPMPLLQALVELARRTPLEGRLEFLFYGSMEEKYRQFIRQHRLDGLVRLMGTVPYLEALGALAQADCLLLIDAPTRDQKESVFLPSKLIDYLGSGKPVLGITPAEGTSARVLRETGNRVCPIDDPGAIMHALEELAAGTLRYSPDPAAVAPYDNLEVSRHFAEQLQQLLPRREARDVAQAAGGKR